MRFEILTEAEEWEPIRPILESLGSALPVKGQGVIFAQFDGEEVVGFQILQNALFAEGLYAKDGRADLRKLWNMLIDSVKDNGGRELLTMTRGDEQGLRIGRAVKRMGFEETGWNVYRRTL